MTSSGLPGRVGGELAITVVVPSCDRPGLVRRALASVALQERPPTEVLVVDNGSIRIDASTISDEVVVVEAPTHAGASQARNIGLVVAQSPYVAFLDDDDTWDACYLACMAEAIERRPMSTVFAGAIHEMDSGAAIAGKNDDFPVDAVGWVRRNPGLVGSNLVVHRERFIGMGAFDTHLRASEDVDIGLRLTAQKEEPIRVPEAIAYYDTSDPSAGLSRITTLLAAKRLLMAKHIKSPLRRLLLGADYSIRLLVSRRPRVGRPQKRTTPIS